MCEEVVEAVDVAVGDVGDGELERCVPLILSELARLVLDWKLGLLRPGWREGVWDKMLGLDVL